MKLLIKFLKILAYFPTICTLVHTFVVLPYIHIDYAHYYKLAQCQAKCTERYGVLAQTRLLDGSMKNFFNISNEEYRMCELGCNHGRIISKKHTRSLSDAFKNGQEFWQSSGKDNTATSGTSPILSLRAICMNIAPMEETGFLDSFQALLTAELKPDFMAPVRYIIQWKQISPAKSLIGSETKWITSSIENSNTFKVEGLQPGVKYRFMITTISPSGKIGKGIHSDWLEIPSLSSIPQQPVGPLSFKQQYNSDDGVGVVVRWNPIPAILEQQVGQTLPSCHYQIAYANDTFNGIQSFEQDESSGFLLKHLKYGTKYVVKLRAINEEGQEMPPDAKWMLEENFKSIACRDIFGPGSLECDPEPVRDLSISLYPSNSTAFVSWTPSTDVSNILFYQLEFLPKTKDPYCYVENPTMTISASRTFAILSLPSETECEFEVALSNFDLHAREATAKQKFTFTPLGYDPNMSQIANLWLIIAPTSVVLSLCVILRFATYCHSRVKKWVKLSKEKKKTQIEKPVMV